MFRNNSGFQNGGNSNINNWTFKSTGSINFRHTCSITVVSIKILEAGILGWLLTCETCSATMEILIKILCWDFSNISSADNLRNFFTNGELDEDNYDALLIRWSNQASSMPNNIVVHRETVSMIAIQPLVLGLH